IGASGLASLIAPSTACFSGSVNLSVLSTLTSLPGFSSYLSASCFATTLPCTSPVLLSLKVTVALPLSSTLIVLIGASGLASDRIGASGLASLIAPSTACFSGSVNLSVLSTLTSLPGFSSYLSASCFATTLPCTSPVLLSLKVTVALPLSSTLIVLIGASGLA